MAQSHPSQPINQHPPIITSPSLSTNHHSLHRQSKKTSFFGLGKIFNPMSSSPVNLPPPRHTQVSPSSLKRQTSKHPHCTPPKQMSVPEPSHISHPRTRQKNTNVHHLFLVQTLQPQKRGNTLFTALTFFLLCPFSPPHPCSALNPRLHWPFKRPHCLRLTT